MNRIYTRLAARRLAAACLLVATARAGPATRIDPEENISDEFGQCLDRAGVLVWDRETCEETELERIMAETERVYAEALRRVPALRAADLRKRQARWAAPLRDHCLNEPDVKDNEGGSSEVENFRFCLIYEYGERISWLRRYGRPDRKLPSDKASSRDHGDTIRAKTADIDIERRYPDERREALRLLDAGQHR